LPAGGGEAGREGVGGVRDPAARSKPGAGESVRIGGLASLPLLPVEGRAMGEEGWGDEGAGWGVAGVGLSTWVIPPPPFPTTARTYSSIPFMNTARSPCPR